MTRTHLLAIALALATPAAALAQSPSLQPRLAIALTDDAVAGDTNVLTPAGGLVSTGGSTAVTGYVVDVAITTTATSIMLIVDPDGAGAASALSATHLKEDGADLEVDRRYQLSWTAAPGESYQLQFDDGTTIKWLKVFELRGGIVASSGRGGSSSGGGSGDLTGITEVGVTASIANATGPAPEFTFQANVEALAAAATTADSFWGATGAAWALRSAAQVRTSLGLGDLYPENSPLVETKGGTGQTTYTQGDLLISDAANSLGKLALGGTVGEILHQVSATAPGYSDGTIAAVDSQGLNAKTYLATIATAGDATLDPADGALQTLAISANTTFDTTLTSLAAAHGRSMQLLVTADGTERTLTFPTGWRWLGTKPATLAASTTALLSLTVWGPDEEDVIAVWTVVGTGA